MRSIVQFVIKPNSTPTNKGDLDNFLVNHVPNFSTTSSSHQVLSIVRIMVSFKFSFLSFLSFYPVYHFSLLGD